MKKFLIHALFLGCLFCGGVSFAFTIPEDAVSVKGFGTLSLVTSDSDNLGYRRNPHSGSSVYKGDVAFRPDSSLGIQTDVQFSSDIRGSVQLLAKDREDNSVENLFQHAFLEYSPSFHWSFRAGRVPLDLFLLSDYRDVGFAYLWARPVPAIYSTLFYDYQTGVEVAYRRYLGRGIAELRGFVGEVDSLSPLRTFGDISFSFEPMWGSNLRYTSGPWRFLAGYQRGTMKKFRGELFEQVKFFRSIPDSAFPNSSFFQNELDVEDTHADYVSAGIAYDNGGWQIQSEVSMLSFEKFFDLTYYAGYLSVGYAIDDWTPYLVFSKEYSKTKSFPVSLDAVSLLSPQLQKILVPLAELEPHVSADQSVVSLGLRRNLSEKIALKVQWDHHIIPDGHSVLWKIEDPAKGDKRVNIYTVSMSFVF